MGPNIFSLSSIDAYIPNARSDNAIGYLWTFSGVTVGATYSFGRDTSTAGCADEIAGNSKACRQVTAMLAYDRQNFGVSSSYDIMYCNTGATNGLTSSDNTDWLVTLNGYAMLSNVKFGMGLMDRKTHAATAVNTNSDLYYLGFSYPLSVALVLDAQVPRLNIKGSANKSTLSVARLTYNLSKRTALYTLGYMKNGGTATIPLDVGGTVSAGMNQFGAMTGVRHTF